MSNTKKFNILLFIITIVMLFVYLVYQSYGLYAVVYGDELYYNNLARFHKLSEAGRPNYIYLSILRSTNFCGDKFIDCSRIINILFFIFSVPFIYSISRLVCSQKISYLIVILSMIDPLNTYTAYFMPESMYYFCFWMFTWYVLTTILKKKPYFEIISALILSLISMVKPHSLFLIPGFLALLMYSIYLSDSSNKIKFFMYKSVQFLGVLLFTRLLLGFLFAGHNGLSLFGSSYGSIAESQLSIEKFFPLLFLFIASLKIHLMAFVLLFSFPLLTLILLFTSDNLKSEYKAISIYSIVVIISLVFISAFLTASVIGTGPYETIRRFHLRYYNFAFPLLFIIATGSVSFKLQKKTNKVLAYVTFIIGILIVYSGLKITKYYDSSFIDNPELLGIYSNSFLLKTLVVVNITSLVFLILTKKIGGYMYLTIFLPINMISSLYYSNQNLKGNLTPDIYIKATLSIKKLLKKDEISKLVVIGPYDIGLMECSLYFNNPSVYTITHPNHTVIEKNKIPKDKKWVLIIGDYSNIKPTYKLEGFSLAKITDVEN